MVKFSEEILTGWTRPPSESEQTKLGNSERMVREAIAADEKLNKKSTETFGQGSYANDTNVRLNSDIDINIKYTGGFYFELPDETTEADVGIDKLSSSDYSFSEFKNDVENALVNKFGRNDVIRNDKCVTVKGNSYRIITDVVTTWNYRRYAKNGSFVLGTKFFSDEGNAITNFPKQHIQNAINKNTSTSKKFKRLTRLHRKLRYKMKEDGFIISNNITSFLLECLVWNVPNNIINENATWTERLRHSIIHLYNKTKSSDDCKDWGEVSELFYLFHSGRKWNNTDVNNYMLQLWNYLEF